MVKNVFLSSRVNYLILLFLLFTSISCQNKMYTDAEIIQHLDESIQTIIKECNLPGIALCLINGSEIFWEKLYGYADIETEKPVTNQTFFRAGSLSKSVTAVAFMKLYEDGLVDLDAPVTKYLPDFSIINQYGESNVITLKSVLAHRSGIPDSRLIGCFTGLPRQAILNVISIKKTLFPAGSKYHYTNPGFTLLEYINIFNG